MNMKNKSWIALTLLLAAGAATPATVDPTVAFHFELEKSAPEDGASVHSISEVRLWFTQVPQDETTSIRVVNEAGEALPTGDVVQDEEDGRIFSVSIAAGLAPGAYTVAWRAMGEDGHVVRGDLSFSVASH
jgi:methionine-rich copper-binding protein CopC